MRALVCPKCKGKLKINYGEGTAVCEYCDTEVVFELRELEEIKKKRELEEIFGLKSIHKYETCEKKMEKLLKRYPADYEILWEYACCVTRNFDEAWMGFCDREKLMKAQDCAIDAVKLAPDDITDAMADKWTEYAEHYMEREKEWKKQIELKNRENTNKVIQGDLVHMQGAYVGEYSLGSNFTYKDGRLYLRVCVKNGGTITTRQSILKMLCLRLCMKSESYVAQTEPGELLPSKMVEVELDPEGFFREVTVKKTILGFRTERTSRYLMIDGARVQLREVSYIDMENERHYTCTINIGETEYKSYYKACLPISDF